MAPQRRSLLIGIENYDHAPSLPGCAADVNEIYKLLQRHADGKINYECKVFAGKTNKNEAITRKCLREATRELFHNYRGDIVFYFSGHGVLVDKVGYLVTSDGEESDYGIPMDEILQMAHTSEANDILLILDCCNSGSFGNTSALNLGVSLPITALRENMTLIAASRAIEPATMKNGRSVFTSAVINALEGGAADHMGWVTASSIYAYVERRFGEFDQQPVYKSHTTHVNVVRECAPLIERYELHQLIQHFPNPDKKFQLDPEFEPEDENGNVHEPVNEAKVAIAHLFKEYRDAGLLKASIPNEQFYWVARRSHTVELTVRGREYWHLVKENKV